MPQHIGRSLFLLDKPRWRLLRLQEPRRHLLHLLSNTRKATVVTTTRPTLFGSLRTIAPLRTTPHARYHIDGPSLFLSATLIIQKETELIGSFTAIRRPSWLFPKIADVYIRERDLQCRSFVKLLQAI